MERLTKAVETISDLYKEYILSETDTVNIRPYDEALQEVHSLLEAYEYTGLTPEEIGELKELLKLAVKSAKNNHSCGIVGCSSCSNYYDCWDISSKIGDCENWQWKHADRLERLGVE